MSFKPRSEPVTDTAAPKPAYLGMLNAIAMAESRAYVYLNAWAEVTPDPEVRAILRKVAFREGEHGMSFARRINELGYEVIEGDERDLETMLSIVRSDASDREKFEAIGLLKFCVADGPDVFDRLFNDHSIDIQTGELLGRYIAEERDTLRLVKGCYDQLSAAEPAAR